MILFRFHNIISSDKKIPDEMKKVLLCFLLLLSHHMNAMPHDTIAETLDGFDDTIFTYTFDEKYCSIAVSDTILIYYSILWDFGTKDGYVDFSNVISQSYRIDLIRRQPLEFLYSFTEKLDSCSRSKRYIFIQEIEDTLKKHFIPNIIEAEKIKCDENHYCYRTHHAVYLKVSAETVVLQRP